MIVLGLTGSIGMGKTTTAGFFRDQGVPVHDSDATVHAIYSGAAAAGVGREFPGTVVNGVVDRLKLGATVLADPEAMKRLEAIVHPLVHEAEKKFVGRHKDDGSALVLLDIPLLFETGAQDRVDGVVVASCAESEQRRRVLARPGMTQEKLALILSRQLPDAEKRARADFVVDTGHGLENARRQVEEIVTAIRSGKWRPRKRISHRIRRSSLKR